MNDRGFSTEFAIEAVKGSPPVAVAAAAFAGMGINEWVAVLTGIYVLAQLGYLLWKWKREAGAKPNG